jgi:hypothetical protein
MGINAQQVLQNDPNYLARQLAQQEIQRYQNFQDPQIGLASTSGALLGRGLANLFQGRGFFEVSDPALRKVSQLQSLYNEAMQNFDPNNPSTAYANLATTLAQAGYGREAAMAAAEANKYSTAARAEARAERSLTIQEEEAKRKVETTERPVSVGTTIKGLNTYRKGSGSQIYVIDEEGKEAEYDPKKHGRYETAEDRIRPSGVQIRDIPGPGGVGIIGREIYDNQGNVIRREYLPGYGPNAALRAGQPSRPAAPGQPAVTSQQKGPPRTAEDWQALQQSIRDEQARRAKLRGQ